MARALCAAAFWALRVSAAADADTVFDAASLVAGAFNSTSWTDFMEVADARSTLYAVSFQDNQYKQQFILDYSFDQHDSAGERKHFQVQGSPDGHGNALRMSIYHGDKTFSEGSPTFPRTELSGGRNKNIRDGVAYSVQWDVYISKFSDPYMFCFAQVFGDGPNVMLRWEQGRYQIWSAGKKSLLSGHVSEDLNKWVTWRMDFKLARSGGYVKVFRGGHSLGQITGNTASGANSYWKQGIYTQHVNQVKDMTMFVRNLRLATAKADMVVV